jgi:hypothetical protein
LNGNDAGGKTGGFMHGAMFAAFLLAAATFLLSWAMGVWSIVQLWTKIRREGKPTIPMSELFNPRSATQKGYPELKRFMCAILVGALSWCVGLVVGVGAGILH